MIFDLAAPFVQASQFEWAEVYVPQAVADFFQPDVFARECMRDADPALLPTDSTVATDKAHFKVARILEGGEVAWQLAAR